MCFSFYQDNEFVTSVIKNCFLKSGGGRAGLFFFFAWKFGRQMAVVGGGAISRVRTVVLNFLKGHTSYSS